jgi:glutamyl/glutaminyl-tRNA synthetase
MALINEALALDNGGCFHVRFDDTDSYQIRMVGKERMALIRQEQRGQLEWLGLCAASYTSQLDTLAEVHDWLDKRIALMLNEDPVAKPEVIGDDYMPMFPLAPMSTAEKVVWDHIQGVNLLVRGVDLLSEYSLYQYFCRLLNVPQPKHVYLPRLKWSRGDMSKSFGAASIGELRADGYTPQAVRDIVAEAALRHPPNGWTLQNLRGAPRLAI